MIELNKVYNMDCLIGISRIDNKCKYAIKDELEDYYCCNDKCDKCATVVYDNDCKECDLFKSNQK